MYYVDVEQIYTKIYYAKEKEEKEVE